MSVVVKILSKDQTKQGFSSAERRAKSFDKSIQKATRSLKFLSVAMLGIGVKGVAEFAKFDNRVREISTLLSDVTEKDIKKLGNEIKKTAATYGQSLDKMAKARYDIISAGFNDAARSAILLEQSAKLAVGGVSDVATTADVLTTILNSYSMSAKDAAMVSDTLFTTVRLGKTTINELASQFGVVASIAPTVGVKLKEVAAMYATLTAAGQRTEISTTAIQASMAAMLSPSEELKKKLKSLGFETGVAAVKQLGFVETLKRVTEGTNAAEKAALFPNVRAMKAVFPLIGMQAGKFAENLSEMGKTAGATDEAVKKMAGGIQFRINQIKTQLSIVLTNIGEKIVLLAGQFLALPKEIKNVAAAVAILGVAFVALGGPITAIIAAGFLIYQAYSKNIGGVKQIIDGLWLVVRTAVERMVSDIMFLGRVIKNVFSMEFQAASDEVVKWTDSWKDTIEDFTGDADKIIDEFKTSQKGKLQDLIPDIIGDFSLKANIETTGGTSEALQDRLNTEVQMMRIATDQKLAMIDELEVNEIGSHERLMELMVEAYQQKMQTVNQYFNAIGNLADTYLNLRKQNIQNELNATIKSEQKRYEKQRALLIKANTIEGKLTEEGKDKLYKLEQQHSGRIDNLKEQARQKELDAARAMKPVKLAQAISNTALGITEAFPNPLLMALIAATGALQIATIAAQPYQTGTTSAQSRTGSDIIPAILTPGEAVIPAPIVRQNIPVVQQLVGGQQVTNNQGSSTINISPVYYINAIDTQGVREFVESDEHRNSLVDMINDQRLNLQVDGVNVVGER